MCSLSFSIFFVSDLFFYEWMGQRFSKLFGFFTGSIFKISAFSFRLFLLPYLVFSFSARMNAPAQTGITRAYGVNGLIGRELDPKFACKKNEPANRSKSPVRTLDWIRIP